MRKIEKIVNEKTGEVLKNNIKFVTASFDDEKGYLFWARKSFAKSFVDVPFPKQLTHAEIGKLTILAKCIWSNTNMLGYRGSGGVKPYTEEMIAKQIGLCGKRGRQFISKMMDLGIVRKVDVIGGENVDTHFYINPLYFFSSNRIPLNLYLLFRDQLDGVLPEWVKQRFAIDSMIRKM